MSRFVMGRQPWVAVGVGALCGGAIGYLCFTAAGHRMIARADAMLDDAARQMQKLRGTVAHVQEAIEEGRQTLRAVEDLVESNLTDGGERRTTH